MIKRFKEIQIMQAHIIIKVRTFTLFSGYALG